jgi:hypothetical protein
MYYPVIEEVPGGLSLRRNKTLLIFYWLLLIFSIICLLPGFLLIFDPETGIAANFVLGFGLILLTGAILLNDLRKKFPERIVFSNQEQLVRIPGRQKEHVFMYSDIDRFIIRSKSAGYIISLRKKDGSVWDLMSGNSSRSADRKLAVLKEKVQIIQDHNTQKIQYLLPPAFTKNERASETTFYWKEQQVEKQLFLVFLMVAGFGMCIGHSLRESDNYFIFLPAFLFVLLLISGYFIYKIFMARTRYSMLVMDMLQISYGQGKISSDGSARNFKIQETMPADELDSVRYSFDGHQSFFYSIMFLNKETASGINNLEGEDSNVGLMDISSILKMYSKLFKFNISGKDIIDIANFAALLQQAVKEKYRK